MNYVWVVEMKGYLDKWVPCAECANTKTIANAYLKEWKRNNPDDKFRLTKYVSEGDLVGKVMGPLCGNT